MALSTNKLFIIFALACLALGLINLLFSSTSNKSPSATHGTNKESVHHNDIEHTTLQNNNIGSRIIRNKKSALSKEGATTTLLNEGKAEENFLPRVLAFVFPQFHKDSLNDRLWSQGFTDWDSLRKAPEKNRLGFKIPRPSELGYYNYSDTEPRRKQGELAKQYGIDGLIFHHYWFYDDAHPGPNLHEPIINMLKDGNPDVPFALHWCASKWTVTWNSDVAPGFKFPEPGVLQKQYFPNDEVKIKEHYDWLKKFFHHPNYIRIDGKPLFMLYEKKAGALKVLKKLRELAKLDGLPDLYFTIGLTKPHAHLLEIEDEGIITATNKQEKRVFGFQIFDKVVSYPNPSDWSKGRSLEIPSWCADNFDGGDKSMVNRAREIAGIISSFDNTPRRNYEEANLFATGEPDEVVEMFRESLDAALYYEACCFPDVNDRLSKDRKHDDRFILINAMNEWAEGMAIEPSDVYGRKFLETIRDTKDAVSKSRCSR
jgi:hypothetical protein